ncbi:DUF2796 domain-containing protein [Pseudomonas sp. N040]|uniref:DUF2796 domain-containing protein n=1 Tax=Pseudomonas sp. N040 TaxID=2785325 RepID=UPI0018A2B0F1|nr:DUF2796 domain-containing protein [Pseudomonas sp. N040]MBF7730896.1 DUF2796 domain-containing protein [Pseudomonas sp. N040]MBW7014539.1 DUF2796 domain-containing protein [Pseudomonas sp. N040]
MRTLLLALPLTLLPLAAAVADDHQHGSLDKHQHGVASLNLALDGNTLEIELESPAMNILGFEHAPSSPADLASVAAARAVLEQPLQLFSLPPGAACTVHKVEVESPLFGHAEHDGGPATVEGLAHNDIAADYALTCSAPEALTSISLAPLFRQFPGTTAIVVQLIGPSGQKGAELSADSPAIDF